MSGPSSSNPTLARALADLRAGRAADADRGLRSVLATEPAQPDALHGIGLLLARAGNFAKATDFVQEALRARPDDPEFTVTLGKLLFNLHRHAEAANLWRRAIDRRPEDAQAWFGLGISLDMQGDVRGAFNAYLEAVRRRPDFAEAHHRIGGALAQMGKRHDAVEALREADRLAPGNPQVLSMLGLLLAQIGKIGDGIQLTRRALTLAPNEPAIASDHATTAFHAGDVPDAIAAYQRCITLAPAWPAPYSDMLLAAQSAHPDVPAQQLELHRGFELRYGSKITRLPPVDVAARQRRAEREPLRIGYVSGGFHAHPIARFMASIWEAHDRDRIEIHAFSAHPGEDEFTKRLRVAAHHWYPAHHMSDAALADAVRKAEVDVLVDLDGHSGGGRLLSFAYKPAPLQVTFLGYSNTTGLAAMDARITDAVADPAGEADAFHTERLLRLPHVFAPFEPIEDAPPVSPPPIERAGHLTLASAAKPSKITDATLRAWGTAMQQLPGALLVLLRVGEDDGWVRTFISDRMQRAGLDPARVEFAGRQNFDAYLAAHARFDLMLDTIPFNGHTTTVQHLWMGVPIVTCAGVSHRGRMGTTLLTTLGLEELIAEDEQRFAQRIVQVATNVERLAILRREMRDRMRASPLTDIKQFTQDFEAMLAYAFQQLPASPAEPA